MTSHRSLGFYLLLAPIALWLVLLVLIPHIDLALVSLQERVGVRQYTTSFANYRSFFEEPLYLVTFARTAIMSVLATALTLIIGFPVGS